MAQRIVRVRKVRVPDDLIEEARQAVGRDDFTTSDLFRLGLAQLAGVDVEDYTPPMGRPRKEPEGAAAA